MKHKRLFLLLAVVLVFLTNMNKQNTYADVKYKHGYNPSL